MNFSWLKSNPKKSAAAAGGSLLTVLIASTTMIVNDTKQLEGRSLINYRDVAGIVTYCDGETSGVVPNKKWTNEECDTLTARRTLEFAENVCDRISRPINPNQLTAFTTFSYNVGMAAFNKSSALRKFNAGDTSGSCAALASYQCVTVAPGKGEARIGKPCYTSNGRMKFSQGLFNRRKKERDLCLKPYSGNLPLGARCK